MIECRKNGLTFYRFENLSDYTCLAHGIFTRQGGVSPPPCQGLNLAFTSEDRPENIRTNQNLAARALGLKDLAQVGQVHGDRALVVRAEEEYRPQGPEEIRVGYDAVITPDPGVGLMIKLADCQGVILFDPPSGTLALVHSGWRGSVANILGKTVARLHSEFGIDPQDLVAGIGPSLGPCCAEFVHFRTELPESFWAYRDGFHFDFWTISRDQLVEAGLSPGHVEISGLCTKCGNHGFYSFRREGVTGRFGLIAGRLEEIPCE